MSKIIVRYFISEGYDKILEFYPGSDELILDAMDIVSIDLSELNNWWGLGTFNISNNHLRTIDLSTLRHCQELIEFDLSYNELERVDFSPLGGCKGLNTIDISHNKIKSINLGGLHHCPLLHSIDISHNNLSAIDLKQLSGCKRLGHLDLSKNEFTNIDISPLRHCPGLSTLLLSENNLQYIDSNIPNSLNLDYLNVSNNQLQNLDLSPFFDKMGPSVLMLNNNELEEIDLSPFRNYDGLRALHLVKNRLNHLDVSPLLHCQGLVEFSFDKELTLIVSSIDSEINEIPSIFGGLLELIVWPDNVEIVEKEEYSESIEGGSLNVYSTYLRLNKQTELNTPDGQFAVYYSISEKFLIGHIMMFNEQNLDFQQTDNFDEVIQEEMKGVLNYEIQLALDHIRSGIDS